MAEVTLIEQSKLITNPQANEVANVFATSFPALSLIPFETISGYHKPITLVDTLPTVNPRDFGVDFVSSFGSSSTYNVPWKNYGGKLEVDKALRKGNPAGAAMQELMQIQAIAKQMTQDMFQGAGGTSMTGISSFLTTLFPGQVVNAGTTASGDLLTMALMDSAFNLITADENTAIFCSQKVRDRLTYLARTNAAGQQNIQYIVDQFGTKVISYNQVPIYCMIDDYTGADILSVAEIDGAATNSDTSSLYIVKFASDAVKGFSPSSPTLDIETANPGTHAAVTRLEANVGITLMQPRSAVRIRYIKQAVS